jgi:ketosteroid isomerase-like protein
MSENADLVRGFYAAAAAGDPRAMELFAGDVEFRMPEVLPHGGVIHGREALAGYFGDVRGRWDGFRAELDDLVDGGERVVALGRFCGRPKANGRYVEVPFALVWTLRDGRAVHVDEHTDTARLLEALRPAGRASAVD